MFENLFRRKNEERMMVEPHLVSVSPYNPRIFRTRDMLRGRALSVKRCGQMSPICCYSDPDEQDKPYFAYAGATTLLAIQEFGKELGIDRVWIVIVVDENITKDDVIKKGFFSNHDHYDFRPGEFAIAVKVVHDSNGGTQEKTGEMFGMSKQRINQILIIANKLPRDLLMEADKFPPMTEGILLKLTRLNVSEQWDVLRRIINSSRKEITVRHVKAMVDRIKGKKPTNSLPALKPCLTIEEKDKVFKLVLASNGSNWEDIERASEFLSEKLSLIKADTATGADKMENEATAIPAFAEEVKG